ncbi:MAG: hypothetical protein SFU98_13850 [Leptospiraceae bacterium]|nr:hypothetical protein [Leptospiraceae bacterium]
MRIFFSFLLDVVAKDGENIVEMHQVGKINKDGRPLKREREVIQEIKDELDVDVIFHPYNKKKGDHREN